MRARKRSGRGRLREFIGGRVKKEGGSGEFEEEEESKEELSIHWGRAGEGGV